MSSTGTPTAVVRAAERPVPLEYPNLATREEKNAVAAEIAGFRFRSPYGPDVRRWLKQGMRRLALQQAVDALE